MKLKLAAGAALALIILLTACGKSEKAGEDTSSSLMEDSVAMEILETPDLVWYDLRGPVDSCIIEVSASADSPMAADEQMKGQGATLSELHYSSAGRLLSERRFSWFDGKKELWTFLKYQYDSEGNLVKAMNQNQPAVLHRNAYGEPVALIVGNEEMEFDNDYRVEYEWNDGRLSGEELVGWEYMSRTRYSYSDDQPGPVEAKLTINDLDMTTESKESFEYIKVDAYGNWTERRVAIVSHTTSSDTEGSGAVESRSFRIERRRIVYYPPSPVK